MTQFKNSYDLVNARSQKVKELALEIDAKLGQGSDEAIQEALDLRPALEEAEQKLNEAQELYQQLQNSAKKADDVAALFVPVSDEAARVAGESNVVSRDAWEKMSPKEQTAFVEKGGKVSKEQEVQE
ncbi:MAG: hypothetical protein ACOYKC_09210 [Anaerolineaceae bacterium]|jgi:hypothetical protein